MFWDWSLRSLNSKIYLKSSNSIYFPFNLLGKNWWLLSQYKLSLGAHSRANCKSSLIILTLGALNELSSSTLGGRNSTDNLGLHVRMVRIFLWSLCQGKNVGGDSHIFIHCQKTRNWLNLKPIGPANRRPLLSQTSYFNHKRPHDVKGESRTTASL